MCEAGTDQQVAHLPESLMMMMVVVVVMKMKMMMMMMMMMMIVFLLPALATLVAFLREVHYKGWL